MRNAVNNITVIDGFVKSPDSTSFEKGSYAGLVNPEELGVHREYAAVMKDEHNTVRRTFPEACKLLKGVIDV
jgi:hypothetical protein